MVCRLLIRRRIWEDFSDEQIKKKNNLNWLLCLPRGDPPGLEECLHLSSLATDCWGDQKHTGAPSAWGPAAGLQQSGPEWIQPSRRSAFYGTKEASGHTLRCEASQGRTGNKWGLQAGDTIGNGGDWGVGGLFLQAQPPLGFR